MVKYRAVSFKKDQIAALYFNMSDIVNVYHVGGPTPPSGFPR